MNLGARGAVMCGLSARDYPLKDALFQFDAIENAGYGNHVTASQGIVDLLGNVDFGTFVGTRTTESAIDLNWKDDGLVCSAESVWFQTRDTVVTSDKATIVVCHSDYAGKNNYDAAFAGNYNDDGGNQCFGLWVLNGWKLVGGSNTGNTVGNSSYCSMKTYGSQAAIPTGTIIMRGGAGSNEVIVNGTSLGVVKSSSSGTYLHKLRVNMSNAPSNQTMNTTYHSVIWYDRILSDAECRQIEAINRVRFGL